MNNIRKIIEERLDNAKLDFNKTTRTYQSELKGQIEAYQDCLNLLPPKRTEAEILKDFEDLGYEIYKNDEIDLYLGVDDIFYIHIWKSEKAYCVKVLIDIQEHKLLSELFTLWGWL